MVNTIPGISVILPVYNVEKYLDTCLDSILSQPFSDFELIAVNDGSTDTSPLILEKRAKQDGRMRIIHQENGGLFCARNTGLAAASGEYILFVDSDDWLLPRTLQAVYERAVRTGADIAVFDYDKVFTQKVQKRFLKTGGGTIDIKSTGLARYIAGYFSSYRQGYEAWNKLYRASLVKELRFQPNREVFSEDMLFNLYALCGAKTVTYVPEAYYQYRQREGSIMQLSKPMLALQHAELVQRFHDYAAQRGLAEELQDVFPVMYFMSAISKVAVLKKKDRETAYKNLVEMGQGRHFREYMRKLSERNLLLGAFFTIGLRARLKTQWVIPGFLAFYVPRVRRFAGKCLLGDFEGAFKLL